MIVIADAVREVRRTYISFLQKQNRAEELKVFRKHDNKKAAATFKKKFEDNLYAKRPNKRFKGTFT